MLAEAERFKAEDEDRLKRVSDGFMCVYPCCPFARLYNRIAVMDINDVKTPWVITVIPKMF
jgi:hypothetical protein